jgi:class 3 adenylate cyclase
MPTTRSTKSQPTLPELPWKGRLYAIRVLFTAMVLVVLMVEDAVCDNQTGAHFWLLVAGALYPHAGHVLLGRFEGRRGGGYTMMVLDGLFSGAVIAAIGPATAPSAVLAAINLFNWMAVGGPFLVGLGMTASLAGFALSEVDLVSQSTSTCSASSTLAGIVLVGYFFVVGRFIHFHIGKLRHQHLQFQTESDAAARAQMAADRALAAVLPPSAAEVLIKKGDVAPDTYDGATILLIEFAWKRTESPSVAALADSFEICDSVIGRHGFECIKTFGRGYLAMSRAPTGPDDAIAAAREVNSYLLDHGGLPGSPFSQRAVRAVIHCGTVTAGLVQPSRLNFELLGEPMEALNALAAFARDQPPGNAVVSESAQRRMQASSGHVAVASERDAAAYLVALAPPP